MVDEHDVKAMALKKAEAIHARAQAVAIALLNAASEQAETLLAEANVAADELRQEGVNRAAGIIQIANETAKLLEEKIEEAIAPLRQATALSQAASERSLEISEKLNIEMQETMKLLVLARDEWAKSR